MPNRTQIVCLHEGTEGHSIDPVFINTLLKVLKPPWIRPWGSNVVRLIGCGGRTQLIESLPTQLRACLTVGGNTTLMVWADIDDDLPDGNALKEKFWQTAEKAGLERTDFEKAVFIFAKDRLENWIEFLNTQTPNETGEGPRVTNSDAVEAAHKLADMCISGTSVQLPPSLDWSCRNWRALVKRMRE